MSSVSPSIRLDFTKMNGAGNDFVMIDNRKGTLTLGSKQIANLCDRHRGIGSDGLLIIESGKKAPHRMRYYNADGYEVDMCGNGARCFTRYAAHLTEQTSGTITFETEAGILEGELLGDNVRLYMSPAHSLQLSQSLHVKGKDVEVHGINTGVPHIVIFVSDLEKTPVVELGRALRHHARFAPAGTNVNFVEIKSPQSLAIRTYERGVEDETQACGTGVVASAIIHHLLTKAPSPISLLVRGNDLLEVDFKTSSSSDSLSRLQQISLKGPADFTFSGHIDLQQTS